MDLTAQESVDAPLGRLALGPAPGPMALSDPLAAAGRKAMWIHLDRLLAREPGVRDPERPDELRRYRVAIRRLRGAMRMFASAYPNRDVKPLRRSLGGLAREVGAVRDLDLRIADLNRWAMERGGEAPAAVTVLSVAWGRSRGRALESLLRTLDSRRHYRFLGRLMAFVDESPADGAASSGASAQVVGDRLASQLWAAYEDLRAFGPVLDSASPQTIHDLRIAGKRFRDDLEFLADVLPPERAWLTERLVALQDHLGTLNDASVALGAVRSFLEHRHGALSAVERTEICAYLEEREEEVATLVGSIRRPWRAVASTSFARRLSRLVVVQQAP